MLLQEAEGADEAGGEDGAHAEDVGAEAEAAEDLGVHALVGVGAEDGLVGAGVVGVGVVRPLLEMGAFVVAGENGAGGEASRGLGLRFYEEEIHPFPLV